MRSTDIRLFNPDAFFGMGEFPARRDPADFFERRRALTMREPTGASHWSKSNDASGLSSAPVDALLYEDSEARLNEGK